MHLKKSVQGLFAVCAINFGVAEIPVLAAPVEQPVAQAVTRKSNQITEEDIREVLKEIQAAREREDIEGVLKFIAPFAHSEVTVESDGGTLTVNLDGKDEHRAVFAKMNAQIQERRDINNRTAITISPDGELGTATIFRVREYITQNGTRFLSAGTDTIRFALINNRPMVVSTTIRGWLAERSSLKP